MFRNKVLGKVQCRLYSTKDYYKILNVPQSASPQQIKSAFYKLSKQYHPDLNPSLDKSKFLEIQEAYETLKNINTKSEHDYLIKSQQKKDIYENRGYRSGLDPNDYYLYRRKSPNSQFDYKTHQNSHYGSKRAGYSDKRKYEGMYYKELYEKKKFSWTRLGILSGFGLMMYFSDMVQALLV
jgi:curved DNA-binding protein CbpA